MNDVKASTKTTAIYVALALLSITVLVVLFGPDVVAKWLTGLLEWLTGWLGSSKPEPPPEKVAWWLR